MEKSKINKKMNPIITQSRLGEKRTIECVDSEAGIFRIYGSSDFYNFSPYMFEFQGGPMIHIGEEFYGLGQITAIELFDNIENSTDTCVYVSVDMNKKTILEDQQLIMKVLI